MNTSLNPFVSAATRLTASDSNATTAPVPLTAGLTLSPLACVPPFPTLTLVVAPLRRS